MGITRWMARRGAPGGTARWAAKGYHTYIHMNPSVELRPSSEAMKDFLTFLNTNRYSLMPSPMSKVLQERIDSSAIRNIMAYVIEVLNCEAAMTENTMDNQKMLWGVIEEELRKAGVPSTLI